MKLLYRCCAGLDVHKQSVSVCIRRRVRGGHMEKEEALFGTFTQDLEQLRQWLHERKVRQVAMESTGGYWIPVWNVLERGKHKFELTLVNPATVRALRGQKSDRIDAGRIAEYLQYGLLRGSFIPPRPVRQMRELTRMRVHIQQDRNRVINRIGRLLETVNLKLGSVAKKIACKSGRAMLNRIAEGPQQPERLAKLALGRLREKIPQLIPALDGRPDEHFRWLLSRLLKKPDWLDAELAGIDARLCEQMAPYEDLLRRLDTISGVDLRTARVLIAELGTDMRQFRDAAHAAGWAGLCPGNSQSAGKRFSGRTRKGDRYLRRILVQSAWAAARTNNCFLAALFFRVARRHGRKKAAVAVAHRILTIAWSIIRDGTEYYERGGDHFDQLHPERTAHKLLRRLERIGFQVTVNRPLGRPRVLKLPMPSTSCPKSRHFGIDPCIHLIRRSGKTGSNSSHPSDSVG